MRDKETASNALSGHSGKPLASIFYNCGFLEVKLIDNLIVYKYLSL